MASSKQLLGAVSRAVETFAQMADLATHEERKRALLAKCDKVWVVAETGRNYTDKHGEVHANPDSAGMAKCIELAARLMGVLVESEKRAREGDGDTRAADVEQIASLLRSVGYRVEKAA